MLLNIGLLLSLTLLANLVAADLRIVVIKRARACFITGPSILPSDVVVDLSVTCTKNPQVFKGVPDVAKKGLTFSNITFTKAPEVSSVQFALNTFVTPKNPTKANLAVFQINSALYDATNAGMRSQMIVDAAGLAKLKGVAFFLEFQIARITKNNGVEGILHKGQKVLKNCVNCSPATMNAVISLAKASGIALTAP